MNTMKFWQVKLREIKSPFGYLPCKNEVVRAKPKVLQNRRLCKKGEVFDEPELRSGYPRAFGFTRNAQQGNKTQGFVSVKKRSFNISSTFWLNSERRFLKPIVPSRCLNIQNNTIYQVKSCEAEKSSQTKQSFVTGNTKHRADLFIRQFSGKSQSLLFAKDAVTLNGVTKRKQALPCKNRVFANSYLSKTKGFVLPNTRFNQVLFASNHFYRLDPNRKLGYLYPTNLDKMSFLFSDLADLPLSLKTYIFLKQKSIHKIGSLIAYSREDLFQLLNKNKKMFAEIKRSSLLTAIYENV